MTDAEKLCQNATCQVAKTGNCLLGHDPVESCPNYARDNIIGEVSAAATASPTDKVATVDICSGDVMGPQDLAALVRTSSVRMLALVGESRAGKTTLLASVYEMFCKGPFAGMAFAGSKTLVGFAKRHHLALLSSGRSVPATPGTSRGEAVAYFHLALSRADGQLVHLVISDRSGEAYSDARINTDLIQYLPELRQADRVCFLLDGAKLASREQRAAYARQFKQMIHAFHDNGELANAKAVEVLATKFDLTRQGDAAEHLEYLKKYEASLVAEFEARGLTVKCYRVCALPLADQSVGFMGLDDAVWRWTAALPRPELGPEPIADLPRQIDRMLARAIGDDA